MHPNATLIAKSMLISLMLLVALFTALAYWQFN